MIGNLPLIEDVTRERWDGCGWTICCTILFTRYANFAALPHFMAEREGFELFDFTVLDIYRITPMKAIDSAGSCPMVFEHLSVRSLLIPPQVPPQIRTLLN